MANQNYDAIISAVESLKENVEKFFGEKANASAGSRARANAQDIIKACRALRKDVQETKNARKGTKTTA